MKVFLSWSGDRSHAVALALREWLPYVIQAVSPWLSSSDVQIGARWTSELALQLEESRLGIICLAPENLSAPWMLYEAGALSRVLQPAWVCPYLFGFSPAELTGPWAQFQAVIANKEGTLALVNSINRTLAKDALDDGILRESFEAWWPRLENKFRTIPAIRKEQAAESTGQTPPDKATNHLQSLVRQLSGSPGEPVTIEKVQIGRVFIVHGRNEAIKEAVARFVEELGLAAIILHEQPDKGRTIDRKDRVDLTCC